MFLFTKQHFGVKIEISIRKQVSDMTIGDKIKKNPDVPENDTGRAWCSPRLG